MSQAFAPVAAVAAKPLAIKICGLSSAETLDCALDAGADMIGFVSFAKSPRHLEPEAARALAARIAGRARVVALLVDAPDEAIARFVEAARPDILQLHGKESPERVMAIRRRFGLPVMKALGVAQARDLDAVRAYHGIADSLLLDAKPSPDASRPGGNGLAFDWGILAGLDPAISFMLSGGLTARNVAQAIAETRAAGVDVSSGVESTPGRKDQALIRAFIAAARQAAAAKAGN